MTMRAIRAERAKEDERVYRRYTEIHSLTVVAKEMGVTKEMVRQRVARYENTQGLEKHRFSPMTEAAAKATARILAAYSPTKTTKEIAQLESGEHVLRVREALKDLPRT